MALLSRSETFQSRDIPTLLALLLLMNFTYTPFDMLSTHKITGSLLRTQSLNTVAFLASFDILLLLGEAKLRIEI